MEIHKIKLIDFVFKTCLEGALNDLQLNLKVFLSTLEKDSLRYFKQSFF